MLVNTIIVVFSSVDDWILLTHLLKGLQSSLSNTDAVKYFYAAVS